MTDVASNVTFTQDSSGQRATVRRAGGAAAAALDNVGETIIENAAGSFASTFPYMGTPHPTPVPSGAA